MWQLTYTREGDDAPQMVAVLGQKDIDYIRECLYEDLDFMLDDGDSCYDEYIARCEDLLGVLQVD